MYYHSKTKRLFGIYLNGSFYEHGYFIVQHFHKTALDLIEREVVGPVFQDLYAACFQGTYQRSMFIEHFKQPRDTGQLNTVYISTKELAFGS